MGWAMISGSWAACLIVVLATPDMPFVAVPLLALGAGIVSWVIHRCYVRVRVIADQTGITVVNPVHTTLITWDNVARVTAGMYLTVVPKAGPGVSAWAVQAANIARMLGRRSFADDVASDLTRLAAEANGQSRSPGDPYTEMSPSRKRELQRQAMTWAILVLLLMGAWVLR